MAEPTERDREMRKAFVEDTFPGCSQIDVGDYNLDALDRLLAAAREEGRREAIEECAKIADIGALAGNEDGDPNVVGACHIIARKIRKLGD